MKNNYNKKTTITPEIWFNDQYLFFISLSPFHKVIYSIVSILCLGLLLTFLTTILTTDVAHCTPALPDAEQKDIVRNTVNFAAIPDDVIPDEVIENTVTQQDINDMLTTINNSIVTPDSLAVLQTELLNFYPNTEFTQAVQATQATPQTFQALLQHGFDNNWINDDLTDHIMELSEELANFGHNNIGPGVVNYVPPQ